MNSIYEELKTVPEVEIAGYVDVILSQLTGGNHPVGYSEVHLMNDLLSIKEGTLFNLAVEMGL